MYVRLLIVVAATLFLSACAFNPHTVEVTPQVSITPSDIGAGSTVSLWVIDDRESQTVGQRGAQMVGADISAHDVMGVIQSELKKGLEIKGFSVLGENTDADAELKSRLRAFKFFIETGFWSGGENTSVVIQVEAEKNGRDFIRTYRKETEERTQFVPGGDAINRQLNDALSSVLTDIFSDDELLEFLAQ